MSAWLAFASALPEILKLINAIFKQWQKSQDEQRLKDKFAEVHKAFEEQNAKKLNDVNNGNFEQRN